MRLLLIAFLMVHPSVLQTTEFQRPWDDPNTAIVIDPYHANPIDWDKLKTEPRVIAIINKATTGASKLGAAYFARKKQAKRHGYLWGSYHCGVSGDPEKQADYYLDTVKPGDDELIALDLEDATSKKSMNAEESLRFIK